MRQKDAGVNLKWWMDGQMDGKNKRITCVLLKGNQLRWPIDPLPFFQLKKMEMSMFPIGLFLTKRSKLKTVTTFCYLNKKTVNEWKKDINCMNLLFHLELRVSILSKKLNKLKALWVIIQMFVSSIHNVCFFGPLCHFKPPQCHFGPIYLRFLPVNELAFNLVLNNCTSVYFFWYYNLLSFILFKLNFVQAYSPDESESFKILFCHRIYKSPS